MSNQTVVESVEPLDSFLCIEELINQHIGFICQSTSATCRGRRAFLLEGPGVPANTYILEDLPGATDSAEAFFNYFTRYPKPTTQACFDMAVASAVRLAVNARVSFGDIESLFDELKSMHVELQTFMIFTPHVQVKPFHNSRRSGPHLLDEIWIRQRIRSERLFRKLAALSKYTLAYKSDLQLIEEALRKNSSTKRIVYDIEHRAVVVDGKTIASGLEHDSAILIEELILAFPNFVTFETIYQKRKKEGLQQNYSRIVAKLPEVLSKLLIKVQGKGTRIALP